MNLKEKDKRVYQCFICGERLSTFDLFKAHITTNHEEGREYITCPLPRCQAPVRDVRSHFKFRHPYDKLPKTCASRAIIWKDISTKHGKMNTKKPHFREGYMTSVKNGKDMHYRSGMECEVYELLERWHEVFKYEEEPFAVRYSFLGIEHDYFPDIRITFKDGTVEIWEVKPSSQTQIGKNKAKWDACGSYCLARSWRFMVLTEKGMKKLRVKVERQGKSTTPTDHLVTEEGEEEEASCNEDHPE